MDATPDSARRLESGPPQLQVTALTSSQLSNASSAPKKKKRRKKKQSSAPTSADVQTDPWLQAVKSLYQEFPGDVTDRDGEVRVFLTPRTEGKIYCSLELAAKGSEAYPAVAPTLQLCKAVGMSSKDADNLTQTIRTLAGDYSASRQDCLPAICAAVIAALTAFNAAGVRSTLTLPLQPEEGPVRKTSIETDGYIIVDDRKYHKKDALLVEKKQVRRPEASSTRFESEFKDISKIGQGGGGSVYSAVDRFDEKTYAIKIVKLKHRSPEKIRKLTKEVALLSELYHEHIVRYYNTWTEEHADSSSDEDEDDDSYSDESDESSESSMSSVESDLGSAINFQSSSDDLDDASEVSLSSESDAPEQTRAQGMRYLYIKMEYCEGQTLRAVLDSETQLEPSERWRMFIEILEALSYMHSRALVHRDLKPANIFLDKANRVKIGDFGLATTSKRKANETSDDEGGTSNSASCGVGTPFYASPEQEAGKSVDAKSDMYSLGVIFFEMWRQFGSTMQRADEFRKLQSTFTLPKDFVEAMEQTDRNVVAVIRQLIRENPEERPKAREMLFSELLPHRFDRQLFDEFVRTVLDPTSERKWVLDALFTRQANPEDVDFSFSISSNNLESRQEESRRLLKQQSLVQSSVQNRFQSIFERMGAIQMPAPLINPYYDFLKISEQLPNGQCVLTRVETEAVRKGQVVTYMENTGVLVSLPSCALVPWARMISRKNLGGILRRYCFYPTFQPRELQEPKESLEAAFDICCEESLPTSVKIQMEAEAIRAVYECLQCLAGELPSFDVHINSSKIVDGLMTWLEVPRSVKTEVLHELCDFQKKKWLVVKARLEQLGLSAEKAEKLGQHMRQSGEHRAIHDYLRSKTGKDFSLFCTELQALEQLISACASFNIPREKLIVNLGILSDGLLCYSGVMFKLLGRHRVNPPQFAFGGRYDNLIQHYEFPDKEQNMFDSRPTRMAGVGAWIHMNHIVELVLKQHAESKSAPQCVVGPKAVVASPDNSAHMLLEKAAYCAELWKAGISADYSYQGLSDQDAKDHCGLYRVRFLISLKFSGSSDEATAAYIDLITNKSSDREMGKNDLIRSLLFDLKDSDSDRR